MSLSLVSLQKYIQAPFFQTDLAAALFVLDKVHVSEAYVSRGLVSTLYINILVFFDVIWDLRCFLRPWKHLFAAKIPFLDLLTDCILFLLTIVYGR